MWFFLVAGIYLYARGIASCFGQTIFLSKRSIALVSPQRLQAYLKESGILYILAATFFVGKVLLSQLFPQGQWVLILFFLGIVICSVLLARCNEKYIK